MGRQIRYEVSETKDWQSDIKLYNATIFISYRDNPNIEFYKIARKFFVSHAECTLAASSFCDTHQELFDDDDEGSYDKYDGWRRYEHVIRAKVKEHDHKGNDWDYRNFFNEDGSPRVYDSKKEEID